MLRLHLASESLPPGYKWRRLGGGGSGRQMAGRKKERDRKENATFNQRKLNSPCFLSVALEYERYKTATSITPQHRPFCLPLRARSTHCDFSVSCNGYCWFVSLKFQMKALHTLALDLNSNIFFFCMGGGKL